MGPAEALACMSFRSSSLCCSRSSLRCRWGCGCSLRCDAGPPRASMPPPNVVATTVSNCGPDCVVRPRPTTDVVWPRNVRQSRALGNDDRAPAMLSDAGETLTLVPGMDIDAMSGAEFEAYVGGVLRHNGYLV